MRSSTEIKKEIEASIKKDKSYNNFMNEGGEGYEVESPREHLYRELHASLEAEFKAEWTLEIFNKRKIIWNTEIFKMHPEGKINGAQLTQLEKLTGLKARDMHKAKAMLGL